LEFFFVFFCCSFFFFFFIIFYVVSLIPKEKEIENDLERINTSKSESNLKPTTIKFFQNTTSNFFTNKFSKKRSLTPTNLMINKKNNNFENILNKNGIPLILNTKNKNLEKK
jgi:energy-coupling factor transporter ATP-binding protein EcfA2